MFIVHQAFNQVDLCLPNRLPQIATSILNSTILYMGKLNAKHLLAAPGIILNGCKKQQQYLKKKKHNGRRDFLYYLHYFCALFVACIVTCIAWHCLREGGGWGEESVWEQ